MGVVLCAPLFDDDLGFTQRIEDFAVQTFIAQLAVETFAVAILPGTARLDVERRRANSTQPATQCAFDKFRTVIRTQMRRDPVCGHHRGECFDGLFTP